MTICFEEKSVNVSAEEEAQTPAASPLLGEAKTAKPRFMDFENSFSLPDCETEICPRYMLWLTWLS